jgi:hypothetical protein
MTTPIVIHPLPQPEPSLSPYQARMAKAPEIQNDSFFESFADLLDVINPLQHIPVVSTAYRELTGDTISTGARLAGGALFGGPLGLIAAIGNSIFEQETGGDIGKTLFAAAAKRYEETSLFS